MTGDYCPRCGEPLLWDEVDIGVGVQRGPAWCQNPDCDYSEDRDNKEADDGQEDEG